MATLVELAASFRFLRGIFNAMLVLRRFSFNDILFIVYGRLRIPRGLADAHQSYDKPETMKRKYTTVHEVHSPCLFTGGFIHFLRFTSDKAGTTPVNAPPRLTNFSAKNLTACKVKFPKGSSLHHVAVVGIYYPYLENEVVTFLLCDFYGERFNGDVIDAG